MFKFVWRRPVKIAWSCRDEVHAIKRINIAEIFKSRLKVLYNDIVAYYKNFVLATNHDSSRAIVNPYIVYFFLTFNRVCSGILGYRKNLNGVVFTTHNNFIIKFVPDDLMGFSLHSKRSYFNHSQVVYNFYTCIWAFAESTGYQLSSVTVDNILTFLYRILS